MTSENLLSRKRRADFKDSCALLNSIFRDPTIFQSHDPVAVFGISLGVGDLHDGRAFVVKALKHLHDFFALAGVQIARGFVRENHSRIGDYRTRDPDQLLLSSR